MSIIDPASRTEIQSAGGVFVLVECHSLNFRPNFAILMANGTDRPLTIERDATEAESPTFMKGVRNSRFLVLVGVYDGLHCDPSFLAQEERKFLAKGPRKEYQWGAERAVVGPGQTLSCGFSEGGWEKLPRKGEEIVLELPLYSEDPTAEPVRFRFVFRRK
jgi:hypothetical protein